MFKYLFLCTGLVANILIIIGIGINLTAFNHGGRIMTICGSVLFFAPPIFLALSMVRDQVVFLIHSSKREVKGSDEDEPEDAEGNEMTPLMGNRSMT